LFEFFNFVFVNEFSFLVANGEWEAAAKPYAGLMDALRLDLSPPVHRNGAAGCAFNTLSDQVRSSAGTLQGGVLPLHGPSFWTTSVEGALI
jgi:hypothetical protein